MAVGVTAGVAVGVAASLKSAVRMAVDVADVLKVRDLFCSHKRTWRVA